MLEVGEVCVAIVLHPRGKDEEEYGDDGSKGWGAEGKIVDSRVMSF